MKNPIALALAALIVLACIPVAQAAQSGSASGDSVQHCMTYNLAKIIAVVNAGTVEVCIVYDEETPAGTTPIVLGRASGPDNGAGLAITYTWSIVAGTTVGCTTAALTTSSFNSAAASGSNTYFATTFSGGSQNCLGVLDLVVTATTTTLVHWQGTWDTDVSLVDFNNHVSGTLTVSDDANGWAVHQDATTGSLTVTNAGSQSIAVSGSLGVDLLDDTTADGKVSVASNSSVSVINPQTTITNNPGFWELFGPMLLVFAFCYVLTRREVPLYIVPASLVAGLAVMLMAFVQPYASLILLQALAGMFLSVFSIGMMVQRRLEFKPRRRGPFDG